MEAGCLWSAGKLVSVPGFEAPSRECFTLEGAVWVSRGSRSLDPIPKGIPLCSRVCVHTKLEDGAWMCTHTHIDSAWGADFWGCG